MPRSHEFEEVSRAGHRQDQCGPLVDVLVACWCIPRPGLLLRGFMATSASSSAINMDAPPWRFAMTGLHVVPWPHKGANRSLRRGVPPPQFMPAFFASDVAKFRHDNRKEHRT